MTTMSLRTGTEGPRHDPYSFSELTVFGRNGVTTLHLGLTVWCSNGSLRMNDEKGAFALFEAFVGVPYPVAHKAYIYKKHILPYKLHAMRCKGEMQNVDGFPGETFDHCKECGFTAGYHFNRGAVE